jgi:hypothetical protein
MDNTKSAIPLSSREGDCTLTGSVTVEWSPGARTRALCGQNRVHGSAAASADHLRKEAF